MARATRPVYVSAPNPVIPRYGLFSVATGPLDLPVHARIGGLQYEVGVCTLPNPYEVNCADQLQEKTFDGTIVTEEGYPFVIYSGIQCGVVGLANWGEERIRKYLYDQLVAGEQATVEDIFSTSGFGLINGLANNPETVTLPPEPDIVAGVAALEEWLYSRYGLPGVIHAPMRAAAYMSNAYLIYRDGSQPWRTAPGTWVSFGNYAGVGPTGQAAATDTTYLYITGQVAIWRTPDADLLKVPLGQVIDRNTNSVDILMEREYVLSFDCYSAGVQVGLAPPAAAG